MSIVSDACVKKRYDIITLRCKMCFCNVCNADSIAAVISRCKCAMHMESLRLHATTTMRKAMTNNHCGINHSGKMHDISLFLYRTPHYQQLFELSNTETYVILADCHAL